MIFQPISLCPDTSHCTPVRRIRGTQDRAEVQPSCLPVLNSLAGGEQIRPPNHFVERSESESRHQLADIFGYEEHVAAQMLWGARKSLAEFGILCGNTNRARAMMALAHEDTPERHQGSSAESKSLGPKQSRNNDISPGPELPIHLDHDPVAQGVHNQRLLCLGQPQLPRNSGVLDAAQRTCARTAVIPGDEHLISAGLGDACGDRTDTDLTDQFH